jgi:hypothetical protein
VNTVPEEVIMVLSHKNVKKSFIGLVTVGRTNQGGPDEGKSV